MSDCDYCGGRGAIETSTVVGTGDWRTSVPIRQTCPVCSGSGEIYEPELVTVHLDVRLVPRLLEALEVARQIIAERAADAQLDHPIQEDLVQLTALTRVLRKTREPKDPPGTVQDFYPDGHIEKREP